MISVIIPCFNSEKFVYRAIKSVLNQEYQDWELILIDNNSSDNTLKILKDIQGKYPDKINVLEETKKGAPSARNRGLFQAKGEWIQFLDADDEILSNKFSHQLSSIKGNDIDLIVGGAKVEGIEAGKINRSKRDVKLMDPWVGLIISNLGITSANLFKRQILIDIGGWDENLTSSQEYNLMFRMLKVGAKVWYDIEELTVIHILESGISRSTDVNRQIEILSNRINLRLDIKTFLFKQGLLSSKLKSHINKYIYSSLKNEAHIIPNFVKMKLKELDLEVPFYFRFLKNIQGYILELKRKVA